MIVRTIVAILVVIAILALMAPVFAIVGFPLDANVEKVLRILIALAALLYILKGADLTPFWRRS